MSDVIAFFLQPGWTTGGANAPRRDCEAKSRAARAMDLTAGSQIRAANPLIDIKAYPGQGASCIAWSSSAISPSLSSAFCYP